MPASSKVTILLADADALRRDGLAAVLAGTENYEVVATVPDGASALDEIRQRRPDVAVIDLNLPEIHGIELVRRVRSEGLGTHVLILAGTSDDDIVREVVRAGGDGYLLNNGPARHLVDAISYVRDGGQYFSPQLQRDGRDRHLLQEPPRPVTESAGLTGADEQEEQEEPADAASRPRRTGRPRSRMGLRRTSPPGHWRERMREEAGSPDPEDHDYQVMSMMADGIRPILDRLDEIDNRVALMEVGDVPLPPSPREWLSHELADTLTPDHGALAPRTARELEAKLPEMIEEAVAARFSQMAGKLQQEIEETHVRTLETFVRNIQVKLVQRVSALEHDMSRQAQAMHQLRESSQRTEDNLSRLITGVDKLAQELPKRLAAASPENVDSHSHAIPSSTPPARLRNPARQGRKRSSSSGRTPRIALMVLLVAILLGLASWGIASFITVSKPAASEDTSAPASGSTGPKLTLPPANADDKTKLQAAQQYADQKDYATAESIYKQILKVHSSNVEALQGLASVLYREDKIQEAASTLDRLPK